MKKLLYSIPLFALMLTVACVSDMETVTESVEQGRIGLNFSPAALATRDVASNSVEADISHIDVLFFDNSEALYHHERVSGVDPFEGTVYLSKARADFAANAEYTVYLVANSTHPASTFAALTNREELFLLSQEDERIHMTGLTDSGVEAPRNFLMDGQAYLTSLGAEPAVKDAVVINNGVQSDSTELSCTLRRAAVKVIVTLKRGSQVTFNRNLHAGYYFRNMPYSTLVMPQYEIDAKLRTPNKAMSVQFFYWEPDGSEVTVVGYFYSHDRKNDNFFERGTSLIVNVPLTYTYVDTATGNTVAQNYENSYYQLQLSKSGAFERNHIYYVSATINAPGAEELSEPVTISGMRYSEQEWITQTIDIGGEEGPKYLKVNREQMEMHNVATDSETLVFASSDPVTVTVTNAYYIDKFGQQQTITSRLSDYNISANPLAELAGNIEVNSDVPTNNTIRYIELRVFQDDNGNGSHDAGELYEDVLVLQYPVIYITNQRGYYSYREDFDCHYQYKGSRTVGVGLQMSGGSWTGRYNYTTDSYVSSGWGGGVDSDYFWASKYVSGNGSTAGMSVRSYYHWSTYSTAATATQDGVANSNDNARMYHVRVTATSADYVVGRPRLDENGFTDDSADNAKLVSPSFMIASRLGAMFGTYGGLSQVSDGEDGNNNGVDDRLDIFREHCKNYAETYIDENGDVIHFTDWRLPTESELRIIISLQGTSGVQADAIDYLLNGYYYMTASGPTYNSKGNQNNSKNESAVRCIRDAY